LGGTGFESGRIDKGRFDPMFLPMFLLLLEGVLSLGLGPFDNG
jgi:hypothetical protein